MMKNSFLLESLDKMIPNPRCELVYNKDYELLIATILSAQTTDKKVNEVTEKLFSKYNIFSLSKANIIDIEVIIKQIGTYKRKSEYIINTAIKLVNDYNGVVPNNREYLESLPGVGRKVCNVVLSNLFNEDVIAVDTHVERVSKRLGLVNNKLNPLGVEKALNKLIPKSSLSRVHHQLVLFGRYICKSQRPNCNECLFINDCKYKKSLK